jgi:hypothetical protein
MAWSRVNVTVINIIIIIIDLSYLSKETIQFVLHAVNLQTPTEYTENVTLNDRTEGVDKPTSIATPLQIFGYRTPCDLVQSSQSLGGTCSLRVV